MHIQPVINSVQDALRNHAGLAGADPSVEGAVSQLVDALGPALRIAAMELAEQAASEVRAQLPEHTVDVVVREGDPTLRLVDAPGSGEVKPSGEEFDARISLRLPPSLKQLIEDAADTTGDSVNAWVVDALNNRARRSRHVGKRYNESFDL